MAKYYLISEWLRLGKLAQLSLRLKSKNSLPKYIDKKIEPFYVFAVNGKRVLSALNQKVERKS